MRKFSICGIVMGGCLVLLGIIMVVVASNISFSNPYNMRNTKLKDSSSRRYTLLKAISKYEYISHKELKVEYKQFVSMLEEMLYAKLIKKNNLSNTYGANAYDCTSLGEEYTHRKDSEVKVELVNILAQAAGKFVGSVISEIF